MRVEAVGRLISRLLERNYCFKSLEGLLGAVLEHAFSLVEVVLDLDGSIAAPTGLFVVTVFAPAISITTLIPLHIVFTV